METFVEDLLNLHMINSGIFKLDNEAFDPQSALEFVYEMIKIRAEIKGIELSLITLEYLPDAEEELDICFM